MRKLSGEAATDTETGEEKPDLSSRIVTQRTVQTNNGRASVQMEGFDMASLKKFKPVEFNEEGKMVLPPAQTKVKKGKGDKRDDLVLIENGEARYAFNADNPNELLVFYMGLSGKKRAQVWRAKPKNKLHQQIRRRLVAQGIPAANLGE